MKNKRVQWKSFNINMPSELIPIYDFLQNELNFILSNDETRAFLDKIDLSKLRGDVWRDLRDSLKFRIKDWPLHVLEVTCIVNCSIVTTIVMSICFDIVESE